jgi:tripartite ATP-independent transporter DctM subunit
MLPWFRAMGQSAEDRLTAAALLAMGILPVLELVLRTFFRTGVPGSTDYVQQLTLWIGFLGAMIATRERSHLNLSTGLGFLPANLREAAGLLAIFVSAAVVTGLMWASLQFVRAEMESPARIAGWVPIWVAQVVLPAAFAVILLRFVIQAGQWRGWLLVSLGILAAGVIGFPLAPYAGQLRWVLIAGLIAVAILGAPIFVVLGGGALVLFLAEGVHVASIPVETYRIIVSPLIPTIPLFTLAGYILAEGGASRRLVRLFRALFGWMPGGLAIAATLVCGFFTTFTGASGVTILAMGGLLLPTLLRNGYPERFSVGLLTGTGSIGLLFPPSLAVILYAVVARIPIPDLFKASLLPGLIMVAAICLFGIHEAIRSKVPRPAFDLREAAAAVWASKWDILLPVIAFGGIFGGFTTLIEAAAITVVYALMVETVIYRDLHVTRDLPRVLVKCVTLIGGVFIILGVAMGLTNYLVDAEVPAKAAQWVQAHIQSRVLFLLALNIFLLIVGCLMDIFSAIVVVVPLILPISQVFNIDPLHLGVIFLANLELGYLTPPVGMNLFLASYRFERPLVEVYRHAVPFLLVLAAVVLLITYVPSLTLGVR